MWVKYALESELNWRRGEKLILGGFVWVRKKLDNMTFL